ncbi:MAG: sensor histidine kinase [Butyricicoccaceae bacterium]
MKFGFRFRMMLAILVVAFGCVVMVSLTNYYDSKRMIQENYVESLDNKMTLKFEWFDHMMQEMYQTVGEISHESALVEQIENYLESEHSYADGMEVSMQLSELLQLEEADCTLYLYLPQTRQMFSSVKYYAVRDIAEDQPLPWENQDGDPFTPVFFVNRFARSTQRVYAYTRSVYDETGEELGVLCITEDERQIYYELVGPMNNTNGESYRILTPEGEICSAQTISEIGTPIEVLPQTQENRMHARSEGDLLYTSVEAPFSRYRLMCESELNMLLGDLRGRQMMTLMSVAFIFLGLLFAAWLLSEYLSKPLEGLVQAMDQMRGGDFTARAPGKKTDEFGVLLDHFNDMASRMEELVEQVVHERTQKKQAELNALQYQIRPHFMYNTLNSIRFAATLQRNQKLAELLGSFIALLEASVQRKGAFLPLREEIDLVKDFIFLQSFRYFDCFDTVYEIDPQAEDCYVPCLLLQPMVENAVFHGVDAKRNDNRIEIAAWLEDDHLYIEVRDNGKGIPQQQASEAEAAEDKRRLTGIGLNNVAQRLRLYYGEAAYFTISSEPGKGTTVRFCLPVSHDPEEYSI